MNESWLVLNNARTIFSVLWCYTDLYFTRSSAPVSFIIFILLDSTDMVRLPALIGCSVTVIVWWIVLVPVISAYMPDDEARKKFAAFNTTFPLLNLHLFNLPLCAIEFLACGKCLSFFDLWASLAVAFLYMMFYLNVLDPLGLHFYIVFTPRTHWCFIPYSMILFAYYGLYHSWSYALQTVGGLTC